MEKYNTADLVFRFKQGDKQAFGALYEMTKSSIYFMCCKYLGNEHDAQDIVADTYLTAMSNITKLENPNYFVSWLNRIAINKCKDFLKRSKPVLFCESAEESEAYGEEIADEFLPESYLESLDRRKRLMYIIDNSLSDVQRMSIILFYYNRESIKSIAEIMECSEGTVKSRLNSAKKIIKAKIEEQGGEKNFAVVGVPFLTMLFDKEANVCNVPNAFSQHLYSEMQNRYAQGVNNSYNTNNMQGNYTNNMPAQNTGANNSNNYGSAPAAVKPKAKVPLGLKIGIGAAAVVVIAGVTIAAVTLTNNAPSDILNKPSISSSSSDSSDSSGSSTAGSGESNASASNTDDEKYGCEYQDIPQPEVPEHKIESVVAYTKNFGETSYDVTAIQVTPCFDINTDKLKTEMEKQSFYSTNCDYQYKTVKEQQEPKFYDDKQFIAYDLTEILFAQYKDGSVDDDNNPQGVRLEISRDVSGYTSPNKIKLYIGGAPSKEKQEFAYNILKSAIGDEYAKFLVYSNSDNEEVWEESRSDELGYYDFSKLRTVGADDVGVDTVFGRKVASGMMYYDVSLDFSNDFDSYSGDYKSIGDTLPIKLSDVISSKAGSTTIDDKYLDKYMKAIEMDTLTYTGTYFEFDGVTYAMTTKANGEVKSTINCQAGMGCEDVSKMITPGVDITVSATTTNGKTKVDYLFVESGIGIQKSSESQADNEKACKALLENGKKLADMIIDGVDCSAVSYDNPPYTADGNVKVMGESMPYTVELSCGESLAEVNVGKYLLKVGSCPENIGEDDYEQDY